jgi:hypothetical protein
MGVRTGSSRSSSKSARSAPGRSSGHGLGLGEYLRESQRPIVILGFLIPLVVLYETGARLYHEDVVAFSLLKVFAGWVNVYGRGVPAALLVLSLLLWHLVRHDRWRVRLTTLGSDVEVVRFLVSKGMSGKTLAAAGFAEFDPVVANDNDQHRAQNRRIEIVLQPNISDLPPLDDLTK